MIIGVDFDNTIVSYDNLFYREALSRRLIPETADTSKEKVRDYLRSVGKEPQWTELQGYVYGEIIREAPAFPGVKEFFSACQKKSIPVFIISHKTKTPFLGSHYDLHAAALKWLKQNKFTAEAFFELTKQGKFDRITRQGCTHFIDDLTEFLSDSGFPPHIEKIWFDPAESGKKKAFNADQFALQASSWDEIQKWLMRA